MPATDSGTDRKIDVLTSYPSWRLRLKIPLKPTAAAAAPIPKATAGNPMAMAPKEALVNKARTVFFLKKFFKDDGSFPSFLACSTSRLRCIHIWPAV